MNSSILAPKIYLIGHSSGAGLLINFAANSARQLVDGYVFLAPYLGPKSNTFRSQNVQSFQEGNLAGSNKSFVKSMRLWVYKLGSIFPNSFITHFKAVFFNYPDELIKSDPLILRFYTYVMSCATTPYNIDLLLKKIDKPVGIFIGKNDEQFIPERIIAYKFLINASVKAEIIEDVGHLSILLKSPKLIADFIEEKRNKN